MISYCKAYPDEKGIETGMSADELVRLKQDCKAYPDEKGIETILLIVNITSVDALLQSLSR